MHFSPIARAFSRKLPLTSRRVSRLHSGQLEAARRRQGGNRQSQKFQFDRRLTYELNATQVPGPDSSGKGNLLSPLARRGDPRAAAELQRRGRTVIYTPDSNTPLYMDSDAFANLLRKLQE